MDSSNSLPAGSLFGIPIRLSYSELPLGPGGAPIASHDTQWQPHLHAAM